MLTEDVYFLPATELAALIRTRELSPVELVDGLFARIRELNGPINAFCTLAEESARAAAREAERMVSRGEPAGPLLGVPISLKDNIETAGIRTTYGSRVFEHFVPTEDAVCAARLKAAGAIVVGKTSLPEFAAKGVVDPPLFGHTRNPWALDRTVGGSSGGAAAAVAAGLGPIAIGNDQAGSVRMPASFCGVAGLKPTGGRIPFFPSDNPWDFIFHVGPLARTVADLDLALRVMEGPDTRDPLSLPPIPEQWDRPLDDLASPWRVAWSPDLGFAEVDREVLDLCRQGFEQLAGAGSGGDAGIDLRAAEEAYVTTVSVRRGASLAEVIDEWEPLMDPFVVDYSRQGLKMSVADIGRAIKCRNEVHLAVERVFAEADLLVTPTLAVTAFPIGQQGPDTINGHPLADWRSWFPFTYPFNLTGHPAATVPVGWTSEGLPVGLQIVGRKFADRDVLAACRYLERARPWAHRMPAIASSAL